MGVFSSHVLLKLFYERYLNSNRKCDLYYSKILIEFTMKECGKGQTGGSEVNINCINLLFIN